MSIEFTSKGKNKKQLPCFELNLFGKNSKRLPLGYIITYIQIKIPTKYKQYVTN
jgi:hypothetical protein